MNSKPQTFTPEHITVIHQSTDTAEELVSDYFKLSTGHWLKNRYDIKTWAALEKAEMVTGPLAQVVRYEARPKGSGLPGRSFDFYRICLQDDAILTRLARNPQLRFYPFILYIITHELIHIVRFGTFLQNFNLPEPQREAEERTVHKDTRKILEKTRISGMKEIFEFYSTWDPPCK